MSSHLAIATITATIQRTLQAAVQTDVEGARITTVRPSDVGNGTPETGVNVFLYQVVTNPALNNLDATPARSRNNPIRRQAALDLYYMFSFYGSEGDLEPQRLLGSVVRTLNDKRVLSAQMLRETCLDGAFSYLRNSTAAEQLVQVSICPLDLNLDDLSKAWSVFFQTPYLLSVAYKVLVVLIEGDESSTRALPVRGRFGGLSAFPSMPQVDRILGPGGIYEPILANSTLVISGRQLKGSRYTQIRLCGTEVTPTEVSDTEITLPLSLVPTSHLRAGVQSLQILHPVELGTGLGTGQSRGQRGAESNAAPFVLRPQVTAVNATTIAEVDDHLYSAEVTVQVIPAIAPDQRVIAVFNEWSTEAPQSVLFEALTRSAPTDTVTIAIPELKAGAYLVRLLVDGAESQLQIDDDPESPTYEWFVGPRIQIG